MRADKIELLAKVIAWRVLSMTCGFFIAYAFTGKIEESAGITIVIGPTLMVVQWGFEVLWDRSIREKLRYAMSREQGRIGRLVRWGRGSRPFGLDINEQGLNGGETWSDPKSPENAGREWT